MCNKKKIVFTCEECCKLFDVVHRDPVSEALHTKHIVNDLFDAF